MFRFDKVGTKRNEDQDEIENLEEIVFNKHKKLKSQNYTKLKDENDDDDEPLFQIDTEGNLDNLEKQEVKTAVWSDEDDEIRLVFCELKSKI